MNTAVALIGNGKVAQYLSQAIPRGLNQVEIFARNPRSEEHYLGALEPGDYDLLLLCVSDDALAEVSRKISASDALVAHVSGASPLEIIAEHHSRKAIWYPLMSMRADLDLDIGEIPFCVETSRKEDLAWLEKWTGQLGATSYRVDSRQRPYLHLAAVLAHNFSNQLYHLAYGVLQEKGLSLDILRPLLQQNLDTLKQGDPARYQTGPAVRGDESTIRRHLEMLRDEDSRNIYQLLTASIQSTHEKEL